MKPLLHSPVTSPHPATNTPLGTPSSVLCNPGRSCQLSVTADITLGGGLYCDYLTLTVCMGALFRVSLEPPVIKTSCLQYAQPYIWRQKQIRSENNAMEQSRSWETDCCSAAQEIPSVLWNLKFRYCAHKSPLLNCMAASTSHISYTSTDSSQNNGRVWVFPQI
jgi:hypothetical protein